MVGMRNAAVLDTTEGYRRIDVRFLQKRGSFRSVLLL